MFAVCPSLFFFFFFNDTATTEIYTLSLHDALPIFLDDHHQPAERLRQLALRGLVLLEALRIVEQLGRHLDGVGLGARSEEHTSELQSQSNLVCRLLLEKKNQPAASAIPSICPTRRS